MKKKLLILSICGAGSIGSILSLYLFSGMLIHSNNGFIRLFPSHFLTVNNRVDLEYNSYYIAGLTGDHIYLGNYTASNQMLVANYSLQDVKRRILPPLTGKRIAWGALKLYVDSSSVYMLEGISPSIVRICMKSQDFSYTNMFKRFNEAVPISPGSLIMNRYDNSLAQNILTKETSNKTGPSNFKYILQKQNDGIFSVDGMMCYDQRFQRIVYLYFYRNEFICLDTNLRIISIGSTIDTVRHAHIRISPVVDGKITFSAPPLLTNIKGCVYGDWFYVQSNLRANNENYDDFKANSVIDIYSLTDSRYHYSFYLPDLHHSKLRDFAVYGNNFIALYDHWMVSFQLHPGLRSAHLK